MEIGAIYPTPPYDGEPIAFDRFCRWLAENDFDAVDMREISAETIRTAKGAGLAIAAGWLPGLSDVLSPSKECQQAGLRQAKSAIEIGAREGITRFFCELAGSEYPDKDRADNFEILMNHFPTLVEFAASHGGILCVESWPGPDPMRPALVGTTELLRAIFDRCPAEGIGFIFDPSHSVRTGVDYIRLLEEFGPRVRYAHGKDALIDTEALYLHGISGPTFYEPRPFGDDWWRYCIPGEGQVDWARVIRKLDSLGYNGPITIELEDDRYFANWEEQAIGFKRAREHLIRYIR